MSAAPTYEFRKLDKIDLRVTSWLYLKCRHALYTYLEFIAKNEYQRRGIKLDVSKICDELREVHGVATQHAA